MGTPDAMNREAVGRAAVEACVFTLLAVWLLVLLMPDALSGRRAFEAASPCVLQSGREHDCLWVVGARVERTEPRKDWKKTRSYWLHLSEADGRTTRTRLEGRPSDADAVRPGTTVEATYWRGQIRYVDVPAEPRHRYTTADVRDDYEDHWVMGSLVAGFALSALWRTYWWARHSTVSRRAFPWQVTVPAAGFTALGFACAFAPLLANGPREALGLAGVAAVPVAALCASAALLMSRRRRGDDALILPPRMEEEERAFPGSVWGDALRDHADAAALVVGPGYLASAEDEYDTEERREMRMDLVPVRLRPRYWSDPEASHLGAGTLVLECESGGGPVRIAAGRRHMAYVLGALESRR
ncbi:MULTISPECIES: hypothetical protein [Streptomyces]|uniref:hypothetical protein n=1 Tax=Streptomyces TaxID=1883 RepID=UPI0011B0DAF8|nr:hypothetical protein [Streptomyces sp. ZL-24]